MPSTYRINFFEPTYNTAARTEVLKDVDESAVLVAADEWREWTGGRAFYAPVYSPQTERVIERAVELRRQVTDASQRHGDHHPFTERRRTEFRLVLGLASDLIAIDTGREPYMCVIPAHNAVASQMGVRPADAIAVD